MSTSVSSTATSDLWSSRPLNSVSAALAACRASSARSVFRLFSARACSALACPRLSLASAKSSCAACAARIASLGLDFLSSAWEIPSWMVASILLSPIPREIARASSIRSRAAPASYFESCTSPRASFIEASPRLSPAFLKRSSSSVALSAACWVMRWQQYALTTRRRASATPLLSPSFWNCACTSVAALRASSPSPSRRCPWATQKSRAASLAGPLRLSSSDTPL
mmetsp:Transcript_9340/g.26192  ORF Transcript_9340/g.26192 Transcript_9340/m.26192 type:complete len:226 (-) Transcript_9340:239-916(-)